MNVLVNIECDVFIKALDNTISVIGTDQESVNRVLREFCDYLYNRLVLTDTSPQWVLQECCSGALEITRYEPASRNTPMYLREVVAFEQAINHLVNPAMRSLADNGHRLDNVVFVNTRNGMIGFLFIGGEIE